MSSGANAAAWALVRQASKLSATEDVCGGCWSLKVTADQLLANSPWQAGSLFRTDEQPLAEFSPCRTWRYLLRRRWAPNGHQVLFVMLNPSTADESNDDPTIRRCIGFAKEWGYNSLEIANLFALRSTDPRELRRVTKADAIGPENDERIRNAVARADLVVAAWGGHGLYLDRQRHVMEMLAPTPMFCLATNKDGTPKHPLYVSGKTQLGRFAWCSPTEGSE